MWDPKPSSSTASSIDNKQNIKGIVEQLDENNDKAQTSTFGSHFTDSKQEQYHQNDRDEAPLHDNKIFTDSAVETTDSGFISGPQTLYSTNLDTDNKQAGAIKQLNTSYLSSDIEGHSKTQLPDLDSGIIEEEFVEKEYRLEAQQKSESNQSKMILPHSVDSGLSEWFCNLNLTNTNPTATGSGLNNLNTPVSSSVQQTRKESMQYQQNETNTIPQQMTLANAWETYYQQNDDGDTNLHLACIYGYEDLVAALIRLAPHPCLLNIQNDESQTPLHLATLTAQPKIIRMLLIAGAKPTIRDRHGNTALHLACMSGEEQCVRALTIPISASEVNEAHRQYGHRANDKSYLLYAQLPPDMEIRNYNGEHCVHIAAEAGFTNILRVLVLYGADINAREGRGGRTPLHIAIERCNEDLFNYLLDECQKLDLETPTYSGLTAYQMAHALSRTEMKNILDKKGAESLSPPESDYYSSDMESDSETDTRAYDRFGDPGYFVGGHNGGNAMPVA